MASLDRALVSRKRIVCWSQKRHNFQAVVLLHLIIKPRALARGC